MRLSLGFVSEVLYGRTATALDDVAVLRCVVDSRQAEPGSLFFAFRGELADGQHYAADALARGAVGAVVRREGAYAAAEPFRLGNGWVLPVAGVPAALQELAGAWGARCPARVVGITGSVGKTVTREVVSAVLGQRFRVLQSERNYNNEIGLPLTMLSMTAEHEYAVLEMGMYALGEIEALARLARPTVGVVTNVGPTHLERLGSLEAIAQAKSELVQSLPATGLAVLNGDDDRVRAMASLTSAPSVRFGLGPGCEVRAAQVSPLGVDGIEFAVESDWGSRRLTSPLLGRHSAYACLAAAAVALCEGLSWDQIEHGLLSGGTGQRLRVVEAGDIRLLDDSYNAAPVSVLAALEVLKDMPGRRVAVLGDMLELGALSEEGHRQVGRAVPAAADFLIAVGPNARLLVDEAAGLMAPEAVRHFASGDEAVRLVPSLLAPGDVVLVKGSRGMRLERLCQAVALGTTRP